MNLKWILLQNGFWFLCENKHNFHVIHFLSLTVLIYSSNDWWSVGLIYLSIILHLWVAKTDKSHFFRKTAEQICKIFASKYVYGCHTRCIWIVSIPGPTEGRRWNPNPEYQLASRVATSQLKEPRVQLPTFKFHLQLTTISTKDVTLAWSPSPYPSWSNFN